MTLIKGDISSFLAMEMSNGLASSLGNSCEDIFGGHKSAIVKRRMSFEIFIEALGLFSQK
jgi:hypothetical protein